MSKNNFLKYAKIVLQILGYRTAVLQSREEGQHTLQQHWQEHLHSRIACGGFDNISKHTLSINIQIFNTIYLTVS